MTTKKHIETVLWRACDTFRGKIDSGKYKDYILSMLFLKYISDVYDEFKEELSEKYKDKPQIIEILMDKAEYKVPDTSRFEYLFENRRSPNIGELINNAKRDLEDANEILNDIFQGVDFNTNDIGTGADKNSTLSSLLEDFSRLNLRKSVLENSDTLGDAYMYLIAIFAGNSGKKGGEFYTPMEVSEVLSSIVLPKDGETIYDPTCGSGSLLIKAFNKADNPNKVQIYGQERNFQTWSMCRINMFLHNIKDAQIYFGDTLSNPQNVDVETGKLKKFDCVVANPPFSLKKWSTGFEGYASTSKNFVLKNSMDKFSRFEWGVPANDKGDYAFILHMIASLKENGRLAVVMPHGVLFRGASEGKIREQIIEHNYLDAVIGLPVNLFYGTSIPTCILVLKKNRKNNDVLFIDASKDFAAETKQNKLREEHIRKIVDTYAKREKINKYSHVATLEEIRENEYNLNIPRYVDTFEDEEEVDIKQVLKDIKQLEAERDQISKEIDVYLKELGLLE